MSRTEKATKNVAVAFLLQGLNTVIHFVTRTVMIKYLGLQAVSLNGLFTEVLQALSLAELGVGSAIVYNLYKPLDEGNYTKVSQLMYLFKKAYQIIAAVTFGVGFLICPFIQYLVNSVGYSVGYIRIVYMLFVVNLAMSYLFSYKISLINADQKAYIISLHNLWISIATAVVNVIILITTRNFIIYLITNILITFASNAYRTHIVNKEYSWIEWNVTEKLSKREQSEVFSNIKSIFIKSLSGKITNSTDNILISAIVSTIQVGLYSHYSLIIGVFKQVANQLAYSGMSSLGNLLVIESAEKCEKVYYRMQYLFFWMGAVSSIGIFCCMESFIMIWLKDSKFIMSTSVLLICCINLFIEIVNRPLWSFMEVSGLFSYDKWVSIAGSVINLALSVVLGARYGIVGIFVGTFATWFIQSMLKGFLLFKVRLQMRPMKFYVMNVIMYVCEIFLWYVCILFSRHIIIENVVLAFLTKGILTTVIITVLFVAATVRTEVFRYYVSLGKSYISKLRK